MSVTPTRLIGRARRLERRVDAELELAIHQPHQAVQLIATQAQLPRQMRAGHLQQLLPSA